MNQLIIASTLMEIRPLTSKTGTENQILPYKRMKIKDDLSVLITGVGSAETIFHLTSLLSQSSFDRVIQVGVAGSFKRILSPGTLVEVKEDVFADLGIDNQGEFLSVFDSGITDPNVVPYNKGELINPSQNITPFYQARSVSVNTVSGSKEIIDQRVAKYDPDIESMEGAGAFYACLYSGIPFLQVRSISNYVEPRNRNSWKLELAVQNLNKWLLEFVDISDLN